MRALLPSSVGIQVLSLLLAATAGALVAMFLAGGMGSRSASVSAAVTPVPVVEIARPTLGAVLMSSAPPPQPNATLAAVSATPLPIAVATPPPTPSADDAWQALQPELDTAWQNGPDQTIPLLEAFLLRAPDFAPGREKLYAALLARGTDLAAQGDTPAAVSEFERAQGLFPERVEGTALLTALTPTPTPEPTVAPPEPVVAAPEPGPPPPARAVVAAAPVVEPRTAPPPPAPKPVAQVRPAPAQPAPPPRPPTPTKVPFRP